MMQDRLIAVFAGVTNVVCNPLQRIRTKTKTLGRPLLVQ